MARSAPSPPARRMYPSSCAKSFCTSSGSATSALTPRRPSIALHSAQTQVMCFMESPGLPRRFAQHLESVLIFVPHGHEVRDHPADHEIVKDLRFDHQVETVVVRHDDRPDRI